MKIKHDKRKDFFKAVKQKLQKALVTNQVSGKRVGSNLFVGKMQSINESNTFMSSSTKKLGSQLRSINVIL